MFSGVRRQVPGEDSPLGGSHRAFLVAMGLFSVSAASLVLAYFVLQQFLRALVFAVLVALCLRPIHAAAVRGVVSTLQHVRTHNMFLLTGVLRAFWRLVVVMFKLDEPRKAMLSPGSATPAKTRTATTPGPSRNPAEPMAPSRRSRSLSRSSRTRSRRSRRSLAMDKSGGLLSFANLVKAAVAVVVAAAAYVAYFWGPIATGYLAYFHAWLTAFPVWGMLTSVLAVGVGAHYRGEHLVAKCCVLFVFAGISMRCVGMLSWLVVVFPVYAIFHVANLLAGFLTPAQIRWRALLLLLLSIVLIEVLGQLMGIVVLVGLSVLSLAIKFSWAFTADKVDAAYTSWQFACQGFIDKSFPGPLRVAVTKYHELELKFVAWVCDDVNGQMALRGTVSFTIIVVAILAAVLSTLLLSSRVLFDIAGALNRDDSTSFTALWDTIVEWMKTQEYLGNVSNNIEYVGNATQVWLRHNGRDVVLTFMHDEVFGGSVPKDVLGDTVDGFTNLTLSFNTSTAAVDNRPLYSQAYDVLSGGHYTLSLAALSTQLMAVLPTLKRIITPALELVVTLILQALLQVKVLVDLSLESLVFFSVLALLLTNDAAAMFLNDMLSLVFEDVRERRKLSDVVSCVLRFSLKMPLFHGMLVWCIYALFGVNGGLGRAMWSIAAAGVALLGVAPVWMLSIAGALELWLTSEWPFSVVFLLVHFLTYQHLSPVLYREIQQYTNPSQHSEMLIEDRLALNPYVIGLSVYGGWSMMGDLVGVLLGPFSVCLVAILVKARRAASHHDRMPTTPDSSVLTGRPMRLVTPGVNNPTKPRNTQ